jgi:hypothetical protein
MNNGTIILSKSGKSDKWYVRLVIWLIVKASGYNYEHTRVYIDGWVFETRHPEGFIKTKQEIGKSENRTFLEPITPLTATQAMAIKSYFDDRIRNNRPYNYAKLLLALLLYKTRPFWELIKWVPFQDDKLFGDFCSAGVDEAYKFAGIDLLPDGYEEITTPGDFLKSKLLKEV